MSVFLWTIIGVMQFLVGCSATVYYVLMMFAVHKSHLLYTFRTTFFYYYEFTTNICRLVEFWLAFRMEIMGPKYRAYNSKSLSAQRTFSFTRIFSRVDLILGLRPRRDKGVFRYAVFITRSIIVGIGLVSRYVHRFTFFFSHSRVSRALESYYTLWG